MLSKKIISLILLLFLCSCITAQPPKLLTDSNKDIPYKYRIEQWQKRIHKEGWTISLVDEIVNSCKSYSSYTPDSIDHWDTFKEIVSNHFYGDCEDIAVLMMGTFKLLNYPYDVRILIVDVAGSNLDHALFKIRLPNGKWMIYETLSSSSLYLPLVEFDEYYIWYYD